MMGVLCAVTEYIYNLIANFKKITIYLYFSWNSHDVKTTIKPKHHEITTNTQDTISNCQF